jgi:hypothetical protein
MRQASTCNNPQPIANIFVMTIIPQKTGKGDA